MKEAWVEKRLVGKLRGAGFSVLKLTTPGTTGVPDRMILRPKWSPGPPWFLELKQPGKSERRKQELIRMEWCARGLLVLEPASTYEEVDERVEYMLGLCKRATCAMRKDPPQPDTCHNFQTRTCQHGHKYAVCGVCELAVPTPYVGFVEPCARHWHGKQPDAS